MSEMEQEQMIFTLYKFEWMIFTLHEWEWTIFIEYKWECDMTKEWPRNDQEMTKKWPRNDQEMTNKWPRMNGKILFTTVNDWYKAFLLAVHKQLKTRFSKTILSS